MGKKTPVEERRWNLAVPEDLMQARNYIKGFAAYHGIGLGRFLVAAARDQISRLERMDPKAMAALLARIAKPEEAAEDGGEA